ncbi:tubulin folding cofactor D [Nitzschia inconspicua]|uniref:Tubulin folding cofactor D n=1 Tax=Nitzschia inconspicua TaxID=303405 RepID=A0A9K3PKB1_9STRA|nr:tubulin folding cofactor D [Nitzschia inconspicua]
MSLDIEERNDHDEGMNEENLSSVVTTTSSQSSSLGVMFEDEQRAMDCIRELSQVRQDQNFRPNDLALEELRGIYDKYLELPSLLDRCVASMMEGMMSAARPLLLQISCRTIHKNVGRTSEDAKDGIHYYMFQMSPLPRILSAIYALSKVRGRKRIQKFLTHQVEDVEPVWNALLFLDHLQKAERKRCMDPSGMCLLEQTDSVDGGPKLWESLYTLWNWMGIIGKIPFDCLVVLDDAQISQLLQLATSHLSETGPIRDVAASCLACWLTRPDMEHSEFLRTFHDWSKTQLKSYLDGIDPLLDLSQRTENDTTIFTILGILQTIVTMLKVSTADRSVLLATVEPYMNEISRLNNAKGATTNILLRKYMIKWWTRIGILYLPPRIASWRYQRGRRVLLNNQKYLQQSKSSELVVNGNNSHLNLRYEESEDYFFLVPKQVEVSMGRVLCSLGDVSTAVRWSSAKGVGRITSRLPAICAEDVLDEILSFFNDRERDNYWHGACLALAEMARGGLLLPHRLEEVVAKIVEAIHYDVPRRQTSIGSHVRDAACYTYWALARAYSAEALRPYVSQLGESIVVAFLFDREVNCRRAASAAFQEMVGRQGTQNFPNGISILTEADFFSLGSRTDAFKSIAYHVAQFEEYRTPMINHLFQVKLSHWDPAIRQLTAEALSTLTRRDHAYMAGNVLPRLVVSCLDPDDLYLRHGSVIGVAEILLAFGQLGLVEMYIHGTLLQSIVDIVPNIEKRRLYRGKGGEQMRESVCRLIECISVARLPLAVQQQVRLLDSVDACLLHPNERIQLRAGEAVYQLTRVYFPVSTKGPSERLQNRIVTKYTTFVRTSSNAAATRGFALALGYLPAKLLAPSSEVLDMSLSCLCVVSRPTARVGAEKDAETRCNALVSLLRISETVLLHDPGNNNDCAVPMTEKQMSRVFRSFCLSMDDYNRDQRGDIGSKCRIAALEGLSRFPVLVCHSPYAKTEFFSHERCLQMIGLALKQFAEKLDSVRSEAARCLIEFLDPSNPVTAFVIKRNSLIAALTPPNCTDSLNINSANWADASITFAMVMKVAEVEEYFPFVVSGLIVSVGGLTQSVSQSASAELLKWCREATRVNLGRLGQVFLNLFKKHKGEGRVILPLLKTIDLLICRECIEALVLDEAFTSQLLALLKMETDCCTDIPRLHFILNVSTGLIRSIKQSADATAFVCSFLTHEFPRIRSLAAEKLYVRIQETDPDLNDDHRAMKLLLHHSWEVEGGEQEGRDVAREVLEVFLLDEGFRSECQPLLT